MINMRVLTCLTVPVLGSHRDANPRHCDHRVGIRRRMLVGNRGRPTVPLTTSTVDPTITEPREATRPDSDSIGVPDELAFTATLIGGGTIDAVSLAGTDVLFWFWTPG